MPENEDYEVGYGKPPKATQFKAGQSGNPKGRPKKTKDFERLMDRELNEPIRITERGQPRTVPTREVLIKALINRALKGERDAIRLVINFMTSQHTTEGFEPDAADREALIALIKRMGPEADKPEERQDG